MNDAMTQDAVHLRRSIRTVAKNKDLWLANAEANAGMIKHDVSELWRDGMGLPGVIAAAGPSLDVDVSDLEKHVSSGAEL